MKLRFTIGRKIGTGFGVLILLTIVAFILTYITSIESKDKTDRVTKVYTPSVGALQELNSLLTRSEKLINKWVFIQSGPEHVDKKKLENLIKFEYPILKDSILTLTNTRVNDSLIWSDSDREEIKAIFSLIDNLFSEYGIKITSTLNSFVSYEDPNILFMARDEVEGGEIDNATRLIIDKLANLIQVQQANANRVSRDMVESFDELIFKIALVGIVLVFGGILIAIFTVRTIVGPISQLKKMLLQMGRGVMPADRIKDRNDEIGEMSIALNGLIEGLRSTTEFANEVGSGNFTSYYKPLSEEDTLGHALLKMREDLRENERILEAKVIERTEEVVRQKEEIERQSQKLEVLYKHVTDSIKYAKRIQEAILPPDNLVKNLLPSSFVLYKPKDIVSGDFYWMHEKDGKVMFAAVDCTGHGVPGAFMSIVGYNLLRHVVTTTAEIEPASILDQLNVGVSETLHHGHNEESTAKDGMDLSFCTVDFKTRELQYAGAFNPLYLIRDGELIQVKADKFPIGFFVGEERKKFTNHKIQLQKGDCIYIFSDGYADQFGGPNGKKFMASHFRELLMNVHHHPIHEQKKILDRTIEDWRGPLDQVDDILVIGLKIED